MLLKSRVSLTCFRACFLPGWAKDLSAPTFLPRYGMQYDWAGHSLTTVHRTTAHQGERELLIVSTNGGRVEK